MEEYEVLAIALIRKIEASGTRWLGRLNAATGTLRFVLSYPTQKSEMRARVAEAVSWEYDLDARKELVVSSMAQLNYDFPDSVPAVANHKPLKVSFYNVELYGQSTREKIDKDPINQWLSSQEIWEGKSADGIRIDPLICQLVTLSNVIQEWESSQ